MSIKDVIAGREARTLGPPKRPKKQWTQAELDAMPPSTRARVTKGQSAPIVHSGPLPRNSKLTPALISKIAEYLTSGAPVEYVAQAVGVSTAVLFEWMAKGQREEHRGSLYEVLVESVERARGEAKVGMTAQVRAGKNWGGAAWLLERIDRDLWAPPVQRHSHEGVLFDEHGRLTAHGEQFSIRIGEATTRALIAANVPLEIGERFISAFGRELETLFRPGSSDAPRSEDPEAAPARGEPSPVE